MKYSVPITSKRLDVFIVEARNGSDAAFKAAERIGKGEAPDQTRELSRQVGSARPLVDDPTTEEVAKP